ncbi:MAG TPA: GldG family protein [Clostridiaceae bacterium]
MKKYKFGNSFKDKKFKYGGYATLFTAVALVILIVLNIMVNIVSSKLDLKFDLTKNKLFSISTSSYTVLKNLKQDVKIIGFFEAGKEDKVVSSILDKYKQGSSKITVEYVDPIKYPTIAQTYSSTTSTIVSGSVVVVSGSKFKVLDSSAFVTYTTDQNTGAQTAQSYAAESKITSALLYVSSDKSAIIDNLTGHEEAAIVTELTNEFDTQNYTVKATNLAAKDGVIDLGALLLINGPKRDISADELTKIKAFLTGGGKALIMVDPIDAAMPNLEALIEFYGLKAQNDITIETNTSYQVSNYANIIIPIMQSHEILTPLSGLNLIIPNVEGFDLLGVKRNTIGLAPLLATSDGAYGMKDLKATTLAQKAGDVKGPLNIAFAITERSSDGNTDHDTRIAIFGSSNILSSSMITASNNANIDLVMNSINWAVGNRDSISVTPKDLTTANLTINSTQQLIGAAFVVLVIPGLVVILGIVVWVRRRHL